jgi:hypothetical protein
MNPRVNVAIPEGRDAPEIRVADPAAVADDVGLDEFELAAVKFGIGAEARAASAVEDVEHAPTGIYLFIDLVVGALELGEERPVRIDQAGEPSS